MKDNAAQNEFLYIHSERFDIFVLPGSLCAIGTYTRGNHWLESAGLDALKEPCV